VLIKVAAVSERNEVLSGPAPIAYFNKFSDFDGIL
jgi:hypothetical protein